MAIKPLKLKRYITEDEAAQLLSALIDEKVTPQDMHDYALTGVVPAYIKFSPKDREKYPTGNFGLVSIEYFQPLIWNHFRGIDDGVTTSIDMDLIGGLTNSDLEPCFQLLPYPLLGGSYVSEANGRWRVFVGRADGGVEVVSDEHYVRMYSPPEVCNVAVIMNDPLSCPEWPAVLHSHGMVDADEFDEYRPFVWESPFDPGLHFWVPRTSEHLRMSGDEGPINWRLIVAALHQLLEPHLPKQHLISDAIAEFKWPGAGKRNVDDALSQANKAVPGTGGNKRQRKATN